MSRQTRKLAIVLTSCAMLLGCGGGDAATNGDWENLAPVPNPNTEAAAQPLRAHPYAVALSDDGRYGLVTLRGSELEPGNELAVIDMASKSVRKTITVGSRPTAVRTRPNTDQAVVLSHLSPWAAVVDIGDGDVVGRIRVGYYAQELVFSSDGDTMYVTNRADDVVQQWSLGGIGSSVSATLISSSDAGVNPAAVALTPDGSAVYVADVGGLGIRVYTTTSLTQIAHIDMNAPVVDIKPMGTWMVATTLNDTNGLPCEEDGDYIGTQGDGIFPMVTDRTCSRGFADIQNEIAFIDATSHVVSIRYTSDSAEISEADREGDHDPALMQVKGALPYAIAVMRSTRAYVTMGASHELVELSLDGATPPAMTMPRTWDTGFAPRGLAIDGDGTMALIANHLGDSVTIIELSSGDRTDIDLGSSASTFPATSAEIGELFFNTSKFATDGDQACVHCHPDSENDGKTWGVDIVRAFGRRSTLPMRNLAETKPLLVEGVFDENDFSLEMEGISFRPDFHDSSYTLQVQRRDDFYRMVSRNMIGREVSFNDMVRHIADFLMVEPRLLPSPFDKTTAQVERGEALFKRPDVGCAACHPAPTFAVPESFSGVTTLGRYDLPRRDLDPDVSIKYIENARDGFFNANTLRGLWDRRGVLFHDGRARTIRETLLTPGHQCLREGERPFNEFNGQVDSNGGISHLTCDQIDDLVAFLKTID